MRSIKLCLLVLLTSYVIDPSNASTLEFCKEPAPPPGKPPVEECANVFKAKEALQWNIKTSFGQRKYVPMGDVEVDMHRALYIHGYAEATSTDVVFVPNSLEKCQLFYHQVDNTGYSSNNFPLNSGTNKHDQKITLMKSEKEIVVAVLDPECRLTAKREDFQKADVDTAKIYQIFSSNLIPQRLDEKIEDTKDKKKKLGHFIFEAKRGRIEGSIGPQNLEDNIMFPLPTVTSDEVQCNHLCQHGRKIVFSLSPSAGNEFANKFKLKKECEWMTVHLNTATMSQATEISLRHSFVKLPLELKVSAMDFVTNKNPNYYEVTVAFYVDVPSGKLAQLVIANSHGRAVRSYKHYPITSSIAFAFSRPDCLAEVIGAPVDNQKDTDGKLTMNTFEFVPEMNLGAMIVTNKDVNWKAVRYIGSADTKENIADYDKHNTDEFKKLDKQKINIEVANDPGGGVDNVPEEPATLNPGDKAVTDPKAVVIPYDNTTDTRIKQHYENIRKMEEKIAGILATKYYFTWSIPAGFGAGSIGSFLICNIILFVFKRSVLTFWYKAMYKRYGSDTTMGAGTTMGKTMGGETIGGGTTMGGTTAGSTTAGGETTGTTAA